MRKKRVWRYYCDFCNRGKCQPQLEHERHCTLNPERVCRMCKRAEYVTAPTMETLKAAAFKSLEAVQRITDCPACVLAGIRQSGKSGHYEFDYKAACETFWQNINDWTTE